MKLYWKDESGSLHHGTDGDFDPDLITYEPEGEFTVAAYALPNGSVIKVRGVAADSDELVRKLQQSYAAWIASQPQGESERVVLAREMFEMLKAHTESQTPRCIPMRTGEAAPLLRLSAHEVHELADGAARLIAATGGAPLLRPVGATAKREAQ